MKRLGIALLCLLFLCSLSATSSAAVEQEPQEAYCYYFVYTPCIGSCGISYERRMYCAEEYSYCLNGA